MKEILEQLPSLLEEISALLKQLPILFEQLKTLPDQVTELLRQFEGYYNLLVFTLTLVIIYIILSALFLTVLAKIGLWRVFDKAGQAGWKSLIPIYNLYVLNRIVYDKGWQFILLLIPVVNLYYGYRFGQDMARSFGKSTGFGVGIFLVAPLFVSMIGYGTSDYQGSQQGMLLVADSE